MNFISNRLRAAALAVATAAAAALLAGCGGGEPVSQFAATRILAFGDESSVIDENGRKYTVNAVAGDGNGVDCGASPIWVQAVASSFGLVFRECPGIVADPSSRILAVPGAQVADLGAQVDGFVAEPQAFGPTDLATVLVGQNDLLALYAAYDGTNADALVADAEARADQVIAQVARIVGAGGRVLLATVPDLGLTPFARSEGADATALLKRLTARFNIGLLLGLYNRGLNDGHLIALVRADDLVQQIDALASQNGYTNTADASCLPDAPLPTCTTDTLGTDANGNGADPNNTWLWADATHLSPRGHASLGAVGVTRSHNNPL